MKTPPHGPARWNEQVRRDWPDLYRKILAYAGATGGGFDPGVARALFPQGSVESERVSVAMGALLSDALEMLIPSLRRTADVETVTAILGMVAAGGFLHGVWMGEKGQASVERAAWRVYEGEP